MHEEASARLLEVAPSLRSASDPARARILSFLATRTDLTACVTDVVEATGLGQPTVSHHLKVLLRDGLVARSPRGSWVDYRLVPTAIRGLAEALVSLVPAEAPSAAARTIRTATPTRPTRPPPLQPPRRGRPLPSSRRPAGGPSAG